MHFLKLKIILLAKKYTVASLLFDLLLTNIDNISKLSLEDIV